MTENEARAAVVEALAMGLTVVAKALNGDCVSVGPCLARVSVRHQSVIFEYMILQHSFDDKYITLSPNEIARLAVEHAGNKIGNEAIRQMERFLKVSRGNRSS